MVLAIIKGQVQFDLKIVLEKRINSLILKY